MTNTLTWDSETNSHLMAWCINQGMDFDESLPFIEWTMRELIDGDYSTHTTWSRMWELFLDQH